MAARGDVILAATFEEQKPTEVKATNSGSQYGLYRSDDKGQIFSLVTNGLPPGPVTALVADPNPANSNTLSFLQNTLSEVNFPAPGGCT